MGQLLWFVFTILVYMDHGVWYAIAFAFISPLVIMAVIMCFGITINITGGILSFFGKLFGFNTERT